ncbi:MAG TPA: hypothetical protein VHL79_00710 [Ramlibacter sp.]|jgi:hypothetical protein|nr:hypothetical protein [Ramlibacter sp.]
MHRRLIAQWLAACGASVFLLLAGCAAAVLSVPAQLGPIGASEPELVVASDVPIALPTGYSRKVPARSQWRAVGTLPEGVVYRPVGTVFAIEGRDVHEAYLVLRGLQVHGFYLPAESRYSPLASPIPLPVEKGAQR